MTGMRPMLRLIALLSCLCFVSTNEAQADGISIQQFGLEELIQQSKHAVLAKVGPRDSKTGTFEAIIEQVWTLPGTKAIYSAGTTETMTFLESNNFVPGRWILVRRYWDAPGAQVIKEGAELILFPDLFLAKAKVDTLFKSSKQARRKLDMMFKKGWKKQYKRSPTSRLAADLSDFDLYESAYEILAKRRALRPAHILDALSEPLPHQLFEFHIKKLGKNRAAFLEQAVKRSVTNGGPLLNILKSHFSQGEEILSSDVKALSIYLSGLRFTDAEHVDIAYYINNQLLEYLETPTGVRDAAKFIPYFSRYIPNRSDGGGSKEHISKYYALLSKRQQAKLVTRLMLVMQQSAYGKVDELSLNLFADTANRLPPTLALSFLLKVQPLIDPKAFDGCDQVSAMVKVTSQLASKKTSLASLKKLSTTLLPMYYCNVDSGLQAELERLSQGKR